MLSKYSVKKPLSVVVVIIMIVILGVVSFKNIGVDLLPNINIPYMIVATVYPGAAPEVVEKEITIPVENGIAAVSGIKRMNSTSSEHVSLIIMELDATANIDTVSQEIQSALKFVAFPDSDLLQEPIIMKLNPTLLPIMQLSIGRDNHSIRESTNYFNEILTRINAVDGVASISSSGLISNLAFVNLDSGKTTETIIDFAVDLLGLDLAIPIEQKEQIRADVYNIFLEADKDETLKTNGKIDSTKILDLKIIPYLENYNTNANEGDESGWATTVIDMLTTELANENSLIRKNVISYLDTILANRYILEDREENKRLFFDMLDEILKESISALVSTYVSSLTSAISADIFDQLLYAQDFNMPAGSLALGATSYIVKVGDQIKSRTELMDMPVFSMDLSESIKEYIGYIELIIRALAQTSSSGTVTLTHEQLQNASDALSWVGNTVTDYPQWIVDTLTSNTSTSQYHMSENSKTTWKNIISNNPVFTSLINSWGDLTPIDWRTQVMSCVRENQLYPSVETILNDAINWNSDYTVYYTERVSTELNTIETSAPTSVDTYVDYIIETGVPQLNNMLFPLDETTIEDWRTTLKSNSTFFNLITSWDTSNDWRLDALDCVINNSIFPTSSSGWGTGYTTYYNARLVAARTTLLTQKPTSATGYATYLVNMLSNDDTSEFYLELNARNNWIEYIAAQNSFVELTDVINASTNINWQKAVLNYATANTTIFPEGSILRNETYWSSTTYNLFDARIMALNTTYLPMETIGNTVVTAMGENGLSTIRSFIDGRSSEEIYSTLTGMLKILGRLGGEGAVTEVVNESGNTDFSVDFVVLYNAIEQMSERLILPLKLSSLANVSFLDDSNDNITSLLTKVDGGFVEGSSVMISIEKEPDKSTAEITSDIKDLLKQLQNDDPDFQYSILSDDGSGINMMIQTVGTSLIWGGILAVLILLLFLREIKSTIVVGSSIIISVVFTFVMMYFAGITLNIVSMGGLALGVGMLVDNSIVVLENIYRLRAQGKSIYEACIQGAKQVSTAIIASTITTIIVFLPVLFIEGLTKQIISDMALTICFALIASLIVALTVVPMSISTISVNKPPKSEAKIMKKIKKGYARILNKSLKHKFVSLSLIIVLFATSILLSLSLGTQFFPDMAVTSLTVSFDIDTNEINKRNETVNYNDDNYYTYDMAVKDIVDIIKSTVSSYDDIETAGISLNTGMSLGGFSLGSESLQVTLTFVDEKERTEKPTDIADDFVEALNSKSNGLFTCSYSSADLSSLAGVTTGELQVFLYGDDIEIMRTEAKKISSRFAGIDGVLSVDSGVSESEKEYKIVIDKAKANVYGLTVAQVFLQIQKALAEPGSIQTLRIQNPEDLESYTKQEVEVYVYSSDYITKCWYDGYSADSNVTTPIYFRNNGIEEGDTSANEYYTMNNTGKSMYIKYIDSNGITKTKLIANGGEIPLTRTGTEFSYSYAIPEEMLSETNEIYTNITYSTVNFRVKDFAANYSVKREPIDLMTLPISSEDMMGTGIASIQVPLYKLLSDESFVKDNDGNVLYRNTENDVAKIPLAIQMEDGYSSVAHVDRQKCLTMTIYYDESNIKEDALSTSVSTIISDYITNDKPDSIIISTDTTSILDEVFNTLYLVLALAVVLIYLVMVAQFQSFKSPFIIMATIPLAFTGSFLLLYITGLKLSVMALIGLVILMGVVVNNGIVFVDYVNKLVDQGIPLRQALIRTGIDRLRPILMTALTTIIAMLIMALDGSENGQMLQPLAITSIGGLSYATLMTLFVIPIIYELINKKAKPSDRTIAFNNANIDKIDSDEFNDNLDEDMQKIVISCDNYSNMDILLKNTPAGYFDINVFDDNIADSIVDDDKQE